MNSQTIVKSFIGRIITVHIDRPLGSYHPDYGFFYPLNYGYVPNIILPDGDGEELDAYVLGVNIPLTDFTGLCLAVIHRLDDQDDKLIVVPPLQFFTNPQIRTLTHFQEQFFTSVIWRKP